MIFFKQIPDFEFESRKRRERAEKTDYNREPQIFADNQFIGQKNQQKTDEKRACDIYNECRKRKRFEKILERRNIYEITRNRAERAADSD